MATTLEHIAAQSDGDLLRRAIAAADMMGIPNAQAVVQSRFPELLAKPIANSQCISDIYAYAASERKKALAAVPPPPGSDLSVVTDSHLSDAIRAMGLIPTNPT